MKQTFFFLSIIASCMFFWQACSGSKHYDALQNIPSDASGVLAINMSALYNDFDYEAFKKNDLFPDIKEAMPEWESLLTDPKSSGIAIESRFYGFSQATEGSPTLFNSFIIPIEDRQKWETTLTKWLESTTNQPMQQQQKEGYVMTPIAKDMYIAWDDKMAAICGSFDPNANSTGKIDGLFKLDEGHKSIQEEEDFKAFYQNGKHDILFWYAPKKQLTNFFADKRKSREMAGYLSLLKLGPEATLDTKFGLYSDFNNGEMEIGVYYDFMDVVVERFGNFFKEGMTHDFSASIPKKRLGGIQTLAIDPIIISKTINALQMSIPANLWLGQYGLNMNKLANGVGGDVFLATYLPNEMAMDGGGLDFIAGLNIKEEGIGERLIQLAQLVGEGTATREGNIFFLRFPNVNIPIIAILKKDAIIFTSNPDFAAKIADGGYTSDEVVENYDDLKSGWFNTRLNHTAATAEGFGTTSLTLMISNTVSTSFMDLMSEYELLESTQIKFTKEEGKLSVAMQDKGQNSLKSLSTMMGELWLDWDIYMEMWNEQEEEDIPLYDTDMIPNSTSDNKDMDVKDNRDTKDFK